MINTEIKSKHPLLIAGPCSAESEEQVITTALAIAAINPKAVYRAGIWKPRTRPNAFEGVGSPGLAWLKRVKEVTGMLTATEVANAKHVDECLRQGVDILWIGARTTVNPFSVQEIAQALKGCNIPVMVKNPVNAELSLWLGAIERLELQGVKDIRAIHRGFHTSEKQAFRNDPKWELAIEFRLRAPHLPLICDPSHICGNKELIPYVAQKALDLGMDGLMIETHINPVQALSDASQQLTPLQLEGILQNLRVRRTESIDNGKQTQLNELRSSINKADEELLQVLFRRMQYSREIGEYKKKHNLTILQVNRWEELLRDRIGVANAMGLSKPFIKKMYSLIHEESIRKQSEVMN
jgi:chorismate mutase